MNLRGIIKKIVLAKKRKKLSRIAVIGEKTIMNSATAIRNHGTRECVSIGDHCALFCNIQALWGGRVTIGNNTYIGTHTIIQSKESIHIADNCIIANDVIICDNNNHPIEPKQRLAMSQCEDFLSDPLWTWQYAVSAPIVIEENSWIGRRAMIMKGVTVGKGAIVGAGAVVTHDVPPHSIVAGNPARVVKTLNCSNTEMNNTTEGQME